MYFGFTNEDILSNEILLEANEWGGHLAAMASEEMETIHPIPNRYPQGEYLLLFDPLDDLCPEEHTCVTRGREFCRCVPMR